MLRYVLTITLSAFLLFQVQPLIARFILPWFGGTPAVWTTCMLFFQMLLLGGYGYAHWTVRWLAPPRQALLHVGLLLLALVFIPIIPSEAWKPVGDEWPTPRILLLLLVTIGLPYALLSTTGPLLQAWFSRTHSHLSPYPLFVLSNGGSLLALLTYPVVFEPRFRLGTQAWIWSAGFIAFAILAAWTAWRARGASTESSRPAGGPLDSDDSSSRGEDAPGWPMLLMWLALAMFPSVLLLATTSQISQEVAVVPFLWILPLSLYLLSFMVCFDSPSWYLAVLIGRERARRLDRFFGSGWYLRAVFVPLMLGFVALAALSLAGGVNIEIWVQAVGFSGALFFCCICCHGELARSKPAPKHLTLFYLFVSLGGALGGLFVVLAAPLLFVTHLELQIGLAACPLLTFVAILWRRDWWLVADLPRTVTVPCAMVLSTLLVILLTIVTKGDRANVVEQSRGFYGTLTVTSVHAESGDYRTLRNGRIKHGLQYVDPESRQRRTSYYADSSGAGLAVRYHPRALADTSVPLHIGVIGLGTGTMAAYGREGDRVRFYEINPDVIRIARNQFWYLSESAADVTVVLGDARVQLEREADEGRIQHFDILAVDAFSSDAIPMHLLTRECMKIYLQHLKPDGILAFHISNRYLDLRPVVYHLAIEGGFDDPLLVNHDEYAADAHPWDDSSEWVLMTHNLEFRTQPELQSQFTPWPREIQRVIWTDDYGSLWQVLREVELNQFTELFDFKQ